MKLKSTAGFSLIEVMIVVAIVSILAAIAFPSYQESVAKAKRADAQGALVSLAGVMERFYTENNTYCGSDDGGVVGTCVANDSPGIFSEWVPTDGGTAYYRLTIVPATTSTYTLKATGIGSMASDKCGDFTLDNKGVQAISGMDSGVFVSHCWR